MIETYRELTVWRLCNWISTSWIQNINSDFTASTHINGQLSVSHLKTHDQYRWCKNIEASTQSFFGTTVAENRLRSIASMILKSNVESNCPTRFFSDGGSYPKWHKRTCHQAQPFKQFPWSTSHEQSNPTIFHRISQTMYPKKSLKSLSICCFAIAWLSNMFLSKCKSWNTIFFPDEVGWLYFLLFSNFFKFRSLGPLLLLESSRWVSCQRTNRVVNLFGVLLEVCRNLSNQLDITLNVTLVTRFVSADWRGSNRYQVHWRNLLACPQRKPPSDIWTVKVLSEGFLEVSVQPILDRVVKKLIWFKHFHQKQHANFLWNPIAIHFGGASRKSDFSQCLWVVPSPNVTGHYILEQMRNNNSTNVKCNEEFFPTAFTFFCLCFATAEHISSPLEKN